MERFPCSFFRLGIFYYVIYQCRNATPRSGITYLATLILQFFYNISDINDEPEIFISDNNTINLEIKKWIGSDR